MNINELAKRPYTLLTELQNEMNHLFEDPWHYHGGELISKSMLGDWSPAVDIKEEKDRYILTADLPGVDPKNIEVNMDENGTLTLNGHKESEYKEEEKGMMRTERFSGSFFRRFYLTDCADPASITAKSRLGVLEVIIPKRHTKTPKVKKIQVRAEN
jgi:HSP20 family protein